MISLHN